MQGRIFCLDFSVMSKSCLIRKIRLTSKTNDCNTHIAQYLKKKGNQTMKFGQLIECNMPNIFLEISYTKCAGETSPRPFSEKLKLRISPDQ